MKTSILLSCLVTSLCFTACESATEEPMEGFEYHAHIHSQVWAHDDNEAEVESVEFHVLQ
jgi:hypothetical protein